MIRSVPHKRPWSGLADAMDNLPPEGLDVSQELLDLFQDDLEAMAERGLTHRWMNDELTAKARQVRNGWPNHWLAAPPAC
jgi:hypothetical protein